MGTILVICHNLNVRKFYVDNLTVRGYKTVGITSWSKDSPELLKRYAPGQFIPTFVLMWGEFMALESDTEKLRQFYPRSMPIIVGSQQKPDLVWMMKWKIAAHSSGLSDCRHLMNFLQPWLKQTDRWVS